MGTTTTNLLLLAIISVGASRAASQTAQSTLGSNAGIEVSQLRQRVAALTERCEELERENAVLNAKLNAQSPQSSDSVHLSGILPRSSVTQSDVILISLPPSLQKIGDQAVQLGVGMPGGNLHVNTASAKLKVELIGLQRVRMSLQRTSRGLGVQSFAEAGTMWVKQGLLFLRWAPGDQSEAWEALRYSSLQVGEGPTAQTYIFTAPVDVALPMAGSKVVDLPMTLVPTLKIAAGNLPNDWKATPSAAGCDIILAKDRVKVELKLEPSSRTLTVSVIGTVTDPVIAKRHLDQVDAAQARHEDLLQKLEDRMKSPLHTTAGYYVGALYYPPTVEDRTQLGVDIATAKEQIKTTDSLRSQLRAQFDMAQKQAAVLAELQGSTYTLTLPNEVVVAKVTLVAPGGEPAVPVKKGAVHAGSTSH